MKTILNNLKSALQASDTLSYIGNDSIYITPDEALFFLDKTYPQIAITDGPVEHTIEEGESWEKSLEVALMVYQILKPDDQALIGKLSPLVYGVLDIVTDIHSVLFDNKLSISTIESALPISESETQYLDGEDISVLKKTLYYEYVSLEANP